MENNLQSIAHIVDYIEEHLEDALDLDRLAREAGYSKYHLHRLFTGTVGLTVHAYVQRRRLTEAARMLIFSRQPIMEIALAAGYESQQAFTAAFKSMFRRSPQAFRKRSEYYPLQLKFAVDGRKSLRGDRAMEIQTVERNAVRLIGFCKNTEKGFGAIGQCWRKLHARQAEIENRVNPEYLTGVNDYSAGWACTEQPAFDYYAAAEVSQIGRIPDGMVAKELPAGKYAVFRFKGKAKDSLEPVAEYIYREWLLQSTCRLNENERYDFVQYGTAADSSGSNDITYWVPIL